MRTQCVIAELNREGETMHYLANAFYMDDNYEVADLAGAHHFRTFDEAQLAIHRLEHRGIHTGSLDIEPLR